MLPYLLIGLVTGAAYGIAAVGLVLTYISSRVFNLGHGAVAFFVALCFYWLHTVHGWATVPAALLSIGVLGPLMGLVLWAVLFRWLTHLSTAVKLVASVGLLIALPPLALFLFTDESIYSTPGLFGDPSPAHDVLGVTLNENQLAVLVAAALVAVAMTVLMRFTAFGLAVRAVVDSPKVAGLTGTNGDLVSLGAWMVGSLLAGLSGVLIAPLVGLSTTNFTALIIGSFVAVVIARFRSLAWAFVGGLLIGVAESFATKLLPSSGVLATGVGPSIAFVLMLVLLLVYQVRGLSEDAGRGRASELALSRRPGRKRFGGTFVVAAVVVALPLVLSELWVGHLGLGVAMSLLMLSYVVVSGEGGMISLCQITFAGIGAVALGQFMTELELPFLLALPLAGLVAVPFGLVVAATALRLGNLYLALFTLGFALVMDNLVFPLERFAQVGVGVALPAATVGGLSLDAPGRLFYTSLILFGVLALLVLNLRRSTTGLALGAVRSSELAAMTSGVSALRARLVAFGVSSFIAGIAGALYAVNQTIALPADFVALAGLIYLATAYVWGIRSVVGALVAGLVLAVMPHLFAEILPSRYGQLVPVLFGLAALGLAREPRGLIVQLREDGAALLRRLRPSRPPSPPAPDQRSAPVPAAKELAQ